MRRKEKTKIFSGKTGQLFIVWILIVIIGLFYLFTLREGHNWGGDFSMYIQHAKNIAAGRPYNATGYIYNPSCPLLAPRTYPPVFPLMLVPVYWVSGFNLQTMKLIPLIFFLLSLFIIYLNFQNKLSFPSIISIIAIIGFNYFFWDFKDNILSDIPFLFFTYAFFYLVEITYDTRHGPKNTIFLSLLAGVVLYLSYGTRSVGLALVPSLLLYDLANHKKLSVKSILILSVFLLLVLLQNLFFPKDWSYLDQTYFNYHTILSNITIFRNSFQLFWDNGYSYNLSKVLFVFISFFAFLGFLLRLRRIGMYEIFLLIYSTIILIWPNNQGMRYSIPIIPLYLFYFFYFFEEVSSRYYHSLPVHKTMSLVLIITTITIGLSYSLLYIKKGLPPISQGIHTKDSTELFNYVRNNTNDHDVIIFTKPRVLSLMTSRKSSGYPALATDAQLLNYFAEIKASYVLAFNSDSYFLAFLARNKNHFCPVFFNNTLSLYKILSSHG